MKKKQINYKQIRRDIAWSIIGHDMSALVIISQLSNSISNKECKQQFLTLLHKWIPICGKKVYANQKEKLWSHKI